MDSMGKLNERKLNKAELSKREDIIKDMKKNKRELVKRYGKDAEQVMYGRATNLAKKQTENMDPRLKIREMIKKSLSSNLKEEENSPNPLSYINKRRAKAEVKKFISGKRTDGMGDYDAIIVGIDKQGNQKQIKNLNQIDYFVKWAIADKDYKIPSIKEDLDLGHQDDEPHMLKANLYRIGKYAMELYQMMDKFEGQGEVDLPHWWQSKIIKSESMITSAKHYLDFELKEPEIDAMVDVASEEEAISESDSYVRVSKPKYVFDKNNPNFLFVNFKYDTGGGSSMALGKETMSGQIRRLSSAEAMKQATSLAKDLEQKYNIEDIDVYDKNNGIVQIFAVSDDFINMDRINEIDNNDPILMKMRADKDYKIPSIQKEGKQRKISYDKALEFRLEKKELEDKIAQLKSDQEEDAEVEGGPKATMYGKELEKLEQRLAKITSQLDYYDLNESDKGGKTINQLRRELNLLHQTNNKDKHKEKIKSLSKQIMNHKDYKGDTPIKEGLDLVHVYDKDGTLYGTGEKISDKDGKILVRFDSSTEKEFPSSQVRNVNESSHTTDIPSQEEVNSFFEEIQNELHYLYSKPVEEWDEYDLSNWKAKLRKKAEGRPQFSESKYSQLAEKLVKQLKNSLKEEETSKVDRIASDIQKAMNAVKGDDAKTYQLQQARRAMNKGDLDKAKKIADRIAKTLKEARAPKTKEELEAAIEDAERKIEKHTESLTKIDNAPGGGNWSSSSAEGKKERKLKDAQGKLRDKIDTYTKKLKKLK